MMQKGTLFLSIVLIMMITAVGIYIWQNEQDKQQLLSTIDQITTVDTNAPSPTPSDDLDINTQPTLVGSQSAMLATTSGELANYGTITGSLSFPSEEIPEMTVCAEAINTKEEFCTNERMTGDDYQYGLGYNLYLPAGEYFVYAKLANDPYKAYYSEFVTCGLSVDCPSHQPIKVTVTAGETTSGVDPQDWYNQTP